MATKKQYFRAIVKNQNKSWALCFKNISLKLFSEHRIELNHNRILTLQANCYTRIWMYIHSETFATENHIDNLRPADIVELVDEYFELHEIKTAKAKHKKRIGFEIYSGLFPSCTLSDYEEAIFDESKPFLWQPNPTQKTKQNY